MALAVRVGADQRAGEDAGRLDLIATMVLGAAFLGVKAIEYTDKFKHHLVPGRTSTGRDMHPSAGADLLLALLRA